MAFRCVLLSILLLFNVVCKAEALIFLLPIFPPYTYVEDDQIKGIAIDHVKPILDNLKLDYKLVAVPNYARAIEEVKNRRAAGFFLASENEARNDIAVFSKPIITNNWSWFYPITVAEPNLTLDYKQTANIGSIRHTNTHKWLIENGFNVSTDKIDNLIRLTFERHWLSAIFVAEVVFDEAAKKQHIPQDLIGRKVQITKPFGLYISKQVLIEHPDLMNKINAEILKTTTVNN